MISNFKFQISNSEKGVSLIITFFIMIIILFVVLFISVLLYNEVKIIRDIGNSVSSLYAADSGIEKVLFYDRQVKPTYMVGEDNVTAVRGLCTMFDVAKNPINACGSDESPNSSIEHSIYCNGDNGNSTTQPSGIDCDPATCTNCSISFNTTFDDRKYYTTAQVSPSSDGKSSNFEINSTGEYGGTQRKIKILISSGNPQSAIVIDKACATPLSTNQGANIDITVDTRVTIPGDTIGGVSAVIHDSTGNIIANIPAGDFTCSDCEENGYKQGTFHYSWDSSGVLPKAYYVNISVQDTLATPNIKSCLNVWPSPICSCWNQ